MSKNIQGDFLICISVPLKISQNSIRKHLFQSLFFNKVTCLGPANTSIKKLWHRCFPVNFVKFLRTPFLQDTSGQLLVNFFEVSDTAWLHTVPAINERVKTHSSLTKISIFSTVHPFTPTVAKKQITNKQSWFCIYCNTK